MRTFILADNQFITREGIIFILLSENPAVQILEVSVVTELQKELKKNPDGIVVLDYTLFDFISAEQLLIIKERFPKSFWILFSDELTPAFLNQIFYSAYTASNLSVIMKSDNSRDIITALNDSLKHLPFICDTAREILERKNVYHNEPEKLTKTEKAILKEIAMGKTTKEIAWNKNLSFHTVNSHRKNIFRKLEVNNVQEAIKYAVRAGLLDSSDYYI